MNRASMERHLDQVFTGLVEADAKNERREYMNALLRVIAMVCYESADPERSVEISIAVIKAAMQEGNQEELH